jgi:hypothetical protein
MEMTEVWNRIGKENKGLGRRQQRGNRRWKGKN